MHMQYVIICVLFVYVGFHVMYADWSISLSLCTRCVSQERAMIAGWQGCDDHAAHFEARQEDDVRNWQGSFTNSCMLFMRCSEINLGPRKGCGEMLDVITCANRMWHVSLMLLDVLDGMSDDGRIARLWQLLLWGRISDDTQCQWTVVMVMVYIIEGTY